MQAQQAMQVDVLASSLEKKEQENAVLSAEALSPHTFLIWYCIGKS